MNAGHLITEFYQSEVRAIAILDSLRGYEQARLSEMLDAAILAQDLDGDVRVRQSPGPTAPKGAIKGATIMSVASPSSPAGAIASSIVGAGIGALNG